MGNPNSWGFGEHLLVQIKEVSLFRYVRCFFFIFYFNDVATTRPSLYFINHLLSEGEHKRLASKKTADSVFSAPVWMSV